ncbi:2-succinyl-5-enolpyruvyl-6-hydroxy-3-cyclohexene-1-carboxylic-acid synthase [Liquorilactobacillus satsumensis]|uniref:2-succinyl-5-enolpyruvyl-6-hydroxy-3- cyclohexene-1-carboxylic-acid synthase n=1 Tax=Liquorilactobacillus satsumensis TaxID=259059 RepID=UPI0039E79F6B
MSSNQAITQQVNTILEALRYQGITTAVLAPGSRSTPVALLLAQLEHQGRLDLYVDVDERSAGFFALGIVKQTKRPVLLVCTSGTAAANFYPAVCEAKSAHLPLVILTTDRPPELTNIGAPQALDQIHFYGQQVKHFCELPLASASSAELEYLNFNVQRMVVAAKTRPCGPVHFNLPLRKPLLPQLSPAKAIYPKIEFETAALKLAAFDLKQLQQTFANKRGLIIAGPEMQPPQHAALLKWARASAWPILADSLSQLRGNASENVITGYELFMGIPEVREKLKPEVIIRSGGTLVSAQLAAWLKELQIPLYYLDPDQEVNDHTKTATHVLPVEEANFFAALRPVTTPADWLHKWAGVQNKTLKSLTAYDFTQKFCEPAIAVALAQQLPARANLFVSNSMPIRDIERFFLTAREKIKIACNRGANGIDGIISSALGMSAQVQDKQTANFLLIGDLAFFHDMNGLMMAVRYRLQLRIIVVNNNGGGIFSFLPQAQVADFEELFGTAQNLEIAKVAALYHATYQKIESFTALQQVLATPVHSLEIIEIVTKRSENVAQHQQLQQAVKDGILRMLINENQA